jgi:hypothetical protein
MKKLYILVGVVSILSLILTTVSWAQQGMGSGGGQGRGMGAGNSYNRMFDPKTVATVSGEVESLSQSTSRRRMAHGVHLTLKTEKETIPVHLGPSWYLEKQGITFAPKDKVEVTGSRIMYQGQPAIIAQEVKKGDQVLKLRDAAGVPAWAGQRRQ